MIHSSSQSSDGSSVAHVTVKTVKQSLSQENGDSRQIKDLQKESADFNLSIINGAVGWMICHAAQI